MRDGNNFLIIMRNRLFLLPLLLVLFVSCEKMSVAEDVLLGETAAVSIHTRSVGDAVVYPLHIYAFSSTGTMLGQTQLSSADDNISLVLPRNTDCRIVAVSADDAVYSLPSSPSLSSGITMKAPVLDGTTSAFHRSIAQGYTSKSPLQMGSATIYPTTNKADVNIQLNYHAVSLQVNISDFPSDCTNAYISVSSPFTSVSLSGNGEGTSTSRIPLVNSGTSGRLTTGQVYLFPTPGPTTFTIVYTDGYGEHSASVNYLAPLTKGTPYVLNGSYEDGHLHLTGTVTPSSWSTPVALDFTFSDDSSITVGGSSGNDDDSESYSVTSVPEPLSMWNGHLVMARLDAYGQPADAASTQSLLLLSLTDWSDLTSALNSEQPTEAFTLANSYSEYDISAGWRIPTEDEGRMLSALYRDNADDFDALLAEADADPVTLMVKESAARYLCENAERTYSFKNATISNAGATVKVYHLRLVRTVRISQK